MNPLRQVLQTLKHTGSKSNIIIFPDPKRFRGVQHLGQIKGLTEYRMKVQKDLNFEKYLFYIPLNGRVVFCSTEVGASNTKSAQKFMRGHPSSQPIDTKWIRVVDSGMRNANGQSVGEVLAGILDKFPNYELQSEEGREMAIRDIESKLAEVASFEDMPVKLVPYFGEEDNTDDTRDQ